MRCPNCGSKMIQNFSSWECEVCVRESNLTHYTLDSLSSLHSVLCFPKLHKGKVYKQHLRLETASFPLSKTDEVYGIMEIQKPLNAFSNIKFYATCSDANFTDWKMEWETHESTGNLDDLPKFRVYVYGVKGFLPNGIHFNITATVRLR